MAINREASHPQGQFSKLYPVEFPPTYAEIQNKCGDVMKQCCALNAEIFVLAEKVVAFNWDASFGSRYQPAENSLPLYTPLQDVRQPNIDTYDLGVLHRKRYDPRIYAPRSQQRFPSPPPVIPPFQAHEPLYYSRSRSQRQPSVPQREDSSYTLHPLSQNASRIDTPVFGVMPQTPRSASSYVPTVEPRSSRTPPVPKASQSSGQINNLYPKSGTQPRASMPTPRTLQSVPPNRPSAAQQCIPQSRSQPEPRALKATSATPSAPPCPSHSSVPRTHQHPTPTKPSSSSPPFAASSSSPMADNNRLGTHSAPLVDTVSRGPNSASSSSVPVQTVDTQRLAKLKDLIQNGADIADPCQWRFDSHGLHNPHNMCFRNAALQGLVHTSAFAQLFLQLGEVLKRDEFIHVAPLVHATVDFIRMFYHKAGTNRDPQHNFWISEDVTVGHPLEPSTKLFAALTAAMPDLFKATPITVEQGEKLIMQSEEDSGEFLMSYLNKLNFEFDLIGRVLRSPAWRPSSSPVLRKL
ncbi:hypothetical protein CPB85DRAFT_282962 [Mucidula mucida]|nr:hypothetical protein CPB85DRAFT_282962 [Mucidula mucida]